MSEIYQFSKISTVSGEGIVAKQSQKAIELAKARHHLATVQLAENQRELVDYQNEGIKVIRNQSKFDMVFLDEFVSFKEFCTMQQGARLREQMNNLWYISWHKKGRLV